MAKKRDKRYFTFPTEYNTHSKIIIGTSGYTYVDFNTDFFLWFFLESKNIDLLSRLVNAVLYDINHEPLEYITAIYSLEKDETDFEEAVNSILIDAITDKGNFRQIVILPFAELLTPTNADKICAKAYLDFSDISPSPIGKRALHFIFLLNHPLIDNRDPKGLLKTDFHIVNSPKTTELDIPFNEGDIVKHYLQFPQLFVGNLKDVDMDLIILLSVFILTTNPGAGEYYDFFNKFDSGIHRIWESYEQYKKK